MLIGHVIPYPLPRLVRGDADGWRSVRRFTALYLLAVGGSNVPYFYKSSFPAYDHRLLLCLYTERLLFPELAFAGVLLDV